MESEWNRNKVPISEHPEGRRSVLNELRTRAIRRSPEPFSIEWRDPRRAVCAHPRESAHRLCWRAAATVSGLELRRQKPRFLVGPQAGGHLLGEHRHLLLHVVAVLSFSKNPVNDAVCHQANRRGRVWVVQTVKHRFEKRPARLVRQWALKKTSRHDGGLRSRCSALNTPGRHFSCS